MKKNLLVLIACINSFISYSQNGVNEKDFLGEYNLPSNFFDPTFNAKEYIITYYDSLSKSVGKNILPPEKLITDAVHLLIRRKMFDKAYWLLRMNIYNYPKNDKLYQEMGDYYKVTHDMDRAFVWYSRALTVKYKQPSFISDTSIKFDAAIAAGYRQLSEQTGRKTFPPQYLITNIAYNFLKIKKTDKAWTYLR